MIRENRATAGVMNERPTRVFTVKSQRYDGGEKFFVANLAQSMCSQRFSA
jgi:hypothetical protein